MKLNEEQEEAVAFKTGACLVTAAPGSGKTRVVVERTVALIKDGVRPSNILAITFTNKAANELKERCAKSVGENARNIFVSTFHRLCSTILRQYGEKIGYRDGLTILDDNDQVDLMSQVARQEGFELTKPTIRIILNQINHSRENIESDDEMYARFKSIDENYYTIANKYVERLRTCNQIDFSGLLSEAYRLITNHSDVLTALQKRWTFCSVDESQDTNKIQMAIIDVLFSHTNNIFAVGDEDQSIYLFRGARKDNISDFIRKYNAKVIRLGKNYRSTPQIVAVADKLIKHNNGRLSNDFSTDNPSGPPVSLRCFENDREEANFIARNCKQLVEAGKCAYKDIAVLYRLNNMSRALEIAMVANQVPHSVISGFSFFDRAEVRTCLSMLKFLLNPFDSISFHRICNTPKRALGDITVGKIETFSAASGLSIIDAIKQMDFKSEAIVEGLHEIHEAFNIDYKTKSVPECLDHLVKKLRYEEHLKNDPDTYEDRKQNIEELIKDAAQFVAEKGNSLEGYLEQITLLTNADKINDDNSVSLLTSFAAKGCEWKVVFVCGMEDKICPHWRAVEEMEEGLESETRVAYVALTRAAKILCVSYCKKRQDGYAAKSGMVKYKQSAPSQFLFECGLLEKNPVMYKGARFGR